MPEQVPTPFSPQVFTWVSGTGLPGWAKKRRPHFLELKKCGL